MLPPITPLVTCHRLHRLACPCCSTSTCAKLQADVWAVATADDQCALVGLLGSVFRLSFSNTQALAGGGASAAGGFRGGNRHPHRQRRRQQSTGKRGWQWVMVTAVVTVFMQGLIRSTAAAIELLGNPFGGIVVGDRFSSYSHLPTRPDSMSQQELVIGCRCAMTNSAVMSWQTACNHSIGEYLSPLKICPQPAKRSTPQP